MVTFPALHYQMARSTTEINTKGTPIWRFGKAKGFSLMQVNVLKRIRDLREDNDLSQSDVANYLKVSQSVYSRYENGGIEIPVDAVIRLASYYDVSVDYLLDLSNIKKYYP